MSTVERLKDMNDVCLKSRMLRTLLVEYIPDEKQPLSSPLELSKVVSMVQTHKLLYESYTESMEKNQVEHWITSVDNWVNRSLALLSNNMPDKRWAGICLLGVTCQECSPNRFLTSYSIWFDKLLSNIQPPADSQIVKIASCTAISDLLARLGKFPNTKKDGTSHGGKLIQPVLKLLKEDTSEAVWEGAINLLNTVIAFFPASLHRHYDSAENCIASKILSVKCSDTILKKLAHCLALLPKSRGDEDSWSLMLQKVSLSINSHLNDAFQGLEKESTCNNVMRLLVPPGKDHPLPLGGQSGVSENTTERSERLILSRVSILIFCCSTMLTSLPHVQVTLSVQSLLALVERVLMMDGSVPHTMSPFMTAMQQELVCSELPVLHSYALDLLVAIIKNVRSQNLLHAAYIVRLVKSYFRNCAMPDLRIKVYSVIRLLLISMGVGMAIHLAQEVVDNASADLTSNSRGRVSSSSIDHSRPSTEDLVKPIRKKRKHGAANGINPQQSKDSLELEMSKIYPTTPISLKIAALEALESLLTVGSAMRSESWRVSIDSLLMTTAKDSCKGGWANEESNHFWPNESTSISADLQLASFRALLASVLSPARVRPTYLAQCLELFRRGKQEAGTKLSEFCAHALLALEVLIHPRALPIDDYPSSCHESSAEVGRRFPGNAFSCGQNESIPFSNETYKWMTNMDDTSVPLAAEDPNVTSHSEPLSGAQVGEIEASVSTIMEMEGNTDVVPEQVIANPVGSDTDPKYDEMEIVLPDSDGKPLDNTNDEVASENVLAHIERADGITSTGANSPTALSAEKGGTSSPLERDQERDEDCDSDSLRDILAGIRDSDSDSDSDSDKN